MTTEAALIQTFESVLGEILSSWTALELAVQHYDGPIKVAQEKSVDLLESLCDAITTDKYSMEDISEYICEFMLEKFHMELDDDSHLQVAAVALQSWGLCKTGVRPVVAQKRNSVGGSVIRELVEEVEDSDDDDDMMGDGPSSSSNRQPRVVTDEDGWSTVMH